jgi:hypothetical protein
MRDEFYRKTMRRHMSYLFLTPRDLIFIINIQTDIYQTVLALYQLQIFRGVEALSLHMISKLNIERISEVSNNYLLQRSMKGYIITEIP